MHAPIKRPPGPARVTANPLSLWAYMRRMQSDPVARVMERFDQYGDIYYAPFLRRDVYVLRHPEHVHEVLVAQASKFEKPTEGLTANQLRRLLGEGLLNSNGELWRRQRRLIQPAFRKERLEEYGQVILQHALAWRARQRDGATLDVSREMMELTLSIVCKTLFDHEVSTESDHVASAMRVFRRSFGGIDAFLPEWLPTPSKSRSDAALARVDEIVYRLIDRAPSAERRDLASRLATALDEQGDQQRMSRGQLRDELLTLFLAGHETTSHALSWTWYLLASHPQVAQTLYDEIDAVLGARPPQLSDLFKMPYLERVLSEAMRLYPPAYVLTRVASEDAEVGGYQVPKGADMVLWIYHMQHDARWFPEPERFDPDRFSPERRKLLPASAYVPFGAGTRTCIGKQFAILEAQLILVAIAQRFRLALVSEQPVERDMKVTLAPRDGLRMRLFERPSALAPTGTES